MSDDKKLEWFLKVEPFLTINDDDRLRLENKKLLEEKSELEQYKNKIKELWADKQRMESNQN